MHLSDSYKEGFQKGFALALGSCVSISLVVVVVLALKEPGVNNGRAGVVGSPVTLTITNATVVITTK